MDSGSVSRVDVAAGLCRCVSRLLWSSPAAFPAHLFHLQTRGCAHVIFHQRSLHIPCSDAHDCILTRSTSTRPSALGPSSSLPSCRRCGCSGADWTGLGLFCCDRHCPRQIRTAAPLPRRGSRDKSSEHVRNGDCVWMAAPTLTCTAGAQRRAPKPSLIIGTRN